MNQIMLSRLAKKAVLSIGENTDMGEGKCAQISEYILNELKKRKIKAMMIYVTEAKIKGEPYVSFIRHYYVFVPKQKWIIDTQLWQMFDKLTGLKRRKVVFTYKEYNKILKIYKSKRVV